RAGARHAGQAGAVRAAHEQLPRGRRAAAAERRRDRGQGRPRAGARALPPARGSGPRPTHRRRGPRRVRGPAGGGPRHPRADRPSPLARTRIGAHTMRTPRRAPEGLLRRYWEDPDTPVVTAGLSVLSWAYRAAIAVRDRGYRWGVLPTGRLPCPVVSVGNLTLGGSGKTPTVELAVRTLLDMGAIPAVLSRGYGRVTRGVHVVAGRDG